MSGYEEFQAYKNFECMTYEELKSAVGELHMFELNYFGSDYKYWYDM